MAQPSTILFAEDDAGVRESTAEILRRHGFRLLVAQDGPQALEIIAQTPVDVLFTDVVMPGMNGIELAERARRLRPEIKVLFMTAYYSRAEEAKRLGDLLFKPARAPEIEAALNALIAA